MTNKKENKSAIVREVLVIERTYQECQENVCFAVSIERVLGITRACSLL